MRKGQSGFTLVEIAIVLVIIGLLLGGVLKGQELINSAKVKNFANDFRNIPLFIYGYQDKYRALPGDDANVVAHVAGTLATTPGQTGNGVIEGAWDSTTTTDESFLFWQHVRLANLAAGPTNTADTNYIQKNADGGQIGIASNSASAPYITGLKGTYIVCSTSILGKYVKQLDLTLDDGCPSSGSVMAIENHPAGTTTGNTPVNLTTSSGTSGASCSGTTVIDDAKSYTVCMGI